MLVTHAVHAYLNVRILKFLIHGFRIEQLPSKSDIKASDDDYVRIMTASRQGQLRVLVEQGWEGGRAIRGMTVGWAFCNCVCVCEGVVGGPSTTIITKACQAYPQPGASRARTGR